MPAPVQPVVNDGYIQGLIARNGFTDVTSQQQNFQGLYAIQDDKGVVHTCYDIESARRFLILEFLFQHNG